VHALASVLAMTWCVAISGLPACGKTSIGEALAVRLCVPFIDKDAFLERLFDERGAGDARWRERLSVESNALFRDAAAAHGQAVLVSHWRPAGLDGPSGTPTAWLREQFETVVELHCACPVDIALRRFIARDRHPGHLDRSRTAEEVQSALQAYARHLPLALGRQLRVDAGGEVDLDGLAEIVRGQLADDE